MIKFVIIFIIDILLYLFAPASMDRSYMGVILAMAALSIFFYTKNRYGMDVKLRDVHLRHSAFFIICFCIVFFQCDLDYVIGITDNSDDYLWINPAVVTKSLAISNLGLCSLILGYCNKSTAPTACVKPQNYKSAKKVISTLVALFIALYVIFVPKDYLNLGYERGIDAGPVIMIMGYLQAGFIAMMVLYAMDYSRNRDKSFLREFKFPLYLMLIYMGLVLVTGKRTEAIRGAMLLCITYLYCIKSVNYKRIALVGILALGVFSVAGVIRSLSNGTLQESVQMIQNYESLSPFTRELAGSVNTLHIAVDNFPQKVNYNYGETFFPPFLKIVPGLPYLYQNYLSDGEIPSSAAIITNLYFGGERIWGLGSSVVADIYISFGILGVCVVLFVLGIFLKWVEAKTFVEGNSAYMLALSFSVYSSFMFVCRSTLADMFLCFAYACILLYLTTLFCRKNL